MKIRLWLLLLLIHTGVLYAQDSLMADFPRQWEGEWAGELEIFSGKGKVQTLPMKLLIRPDEKNEVWKWTIVYQTDTPDVREYELIVSDREKGHFIIDEKNSILLDGWLLGNVLSCRFSVGKSLLLVNYAFERDFIRFDIFAGNKSEPRLTGAEVEDVGEIYNYPVTTMQRAVLRR
ncbi:MAG: hypothetical protein R3C61_25935 [Bacteroidia bacterium]